MPDHVLPAPPRLVLSTMPVAVLAGLPHRALAQRAHLYGDGIPDGLALPCRWSVGDGSWTLAPAGDPRPELSWPGTRLEINADEAVVTAGGMSEFPLYHVRGPGPDAHLVSSSIFLAAAACAEWHGTCPPGEPAVISRSEATPFPGVRRFLPGTVTTIGQRADGGLTAGPKDPLLQAGTPTVTDPATAARMLLGALTAALEEATAPGTSAAVLLSGGIDSGTVTTLAHRLGRDVHAFTAGSPWGSESAEAAELAEFLGIPHTSLDLSAGELIRAVPQAISILGTAAPEKVDIALTVVALLRTGLVGPKLVLTGYGSDLINLGLPVPPGQDRTALLRGLIDGVDETRYSGELTPLLGLTFGKVLVHPFWHPQVLSAAFAADPLCKVSGGREKGHLRAAMAGLVPPRVAWREKKAMHHGSGLQDGLDRLFGGADRKAAAYRACFREIAAQAASPAGAAGEAGALRVLAEFLDDSSPLEARSGRMVARAAAAARRGEAAPSRSGTAEQPARSLSMVMKVPAGFRAHTANVGIKDDRDDFTVIVSEVPCTCSAVFTQSTFAGPSVRLSREAAATGSARGVVVVSRNANVATGPDGAAHAAELRGEVARVVGCDARDLLVASTGVIGRLYPMDRVRAHLAAMSWPFPEADFARSAAAMMTTDTHPKFVSMSCGPATVVGMAKGVGMMEPNMATLLTFFFTDAAIGREQLDQVFGRVVAGTFNALSIDTDTSTSDTAAVFANGLAGPVDLADLERVLGAAALHLVREIARDGEGATKAIEVRVTGARDDAQAKRIGKSVVNSPLVKTAVHGADPNWGRVAMAIGKCEDEHDVNPDRVSITFGDVTLYPELAGDRELELASKHLRQEEVIISVDLGIGAGHFTVYGCDLTDGYIRINADYTT
jgi:glutamate N-acetyltransferase/amino-acid N-acetyltransferase